MHGKFWLTLGSLVSFIFILGLCISLSTNNYFYNRIWALAFIPVIIYQMAQFIVNYNNLTNLNNENKTKQY